MCDVQRKNYICTISLAGFLVVRKIKKRQTRKLWVKEYRHHYGHIPLIRELRENYPDDYKNYLKMDRASFDQLLSMIKRKISKCDTVMRKAITAEERLAATLRFLATGRSYEDLKFSTGISALSLSIVIPQTGKALYEVLKEEYIKFPTTKDEWMEISKGFQDRWQFINCGGAIDGKHIRIVPPAHSGAMFYNYKNFYSIILLAMVNHNYEFIYVDVGKNGRLSDGGVLEYIDFYRKLKANQLNLPNNEENIKNLNYVFLGDEAFALNEHILKPYAQRELDHEKRIFNYRLSRARNVVENAFGIITSRFQILQKPINMKHENLCYIVLTICALHNFLRRRCSAYLTATTLDREDTDTCIVQRGDWRNEVVDIMALKPVRTTNVPTEAKQNRENYKLFFNSEDGSVPWQEEMLRAGKS